MGENSDSECGKESLNSFGWDTYKNRLDAAKLAPPKDENEILRIMAGLCSLVDPAYYITKRTSIPTMKYDTRDVKAPKYFPYLAKTWSESRSKDQSKTYEKLFQACTAIVELVREYANENIDMSKGTFCHQLKPIECLKDTERNIHDAVNAAMLQGLTKPTNKTESSAIAQILITLAAFCIKGKSTKGWPEIMSNVGEEDSEFRPKAIKLLFCVCMAYISNLLNCIDNTPGAIVGSSRLINLCDFVLEMQKGTTNLYLHCLKNTERYLPLVGKEIHPYVLTLLNQDCIKCVKMLIETRNSFYNDNTFKKLEKVLAKQQVRYDKLKKDFNGKPLDSCLLITNHEILSDPRTLLLNWCMPTIIHGPKISTRSVIHQSEKLVRGMTAVLDTCRWIKSDEQYKFNARRLATGLMESFCLKTHNDLFTARLQHAEQSDKIPDTSDTGKFSFGIETSWKLDLSKVCLQEAIAMADLYCEDIMLAVRWTKEHRHIVKFSKLDETNAPDAALDKLLLVFKNAKGAGKRFRHEGLVSEDYMAQESWKKGTRFVRTKDFEWRKVLKERTKGTALEVVMPTLPGYKDKSKVATGTYTYTTSVQKQCKQIMDDVINDTKWIKHFREMQCEEGLITSLCTLLINVPCVHSPKPDRVSSVKVELWWTMFNVVLANDDGSPLDDDKNLKNWGVWEDSFVQGHYDTFDSNLHGSNITHVINCGMRANKQGIGIRFVTCAKFDEGTSIAIKPEHDGKDLKTLRTKSERIRFLLLWGAKFAFKSGQKEKFYQRVEKGDIDGAGRWMRLCRSGHKIRSALRSGVKGTAPVSSPPVGVATSHVEATASAETVKAKTKAEAATVAANTTAAEATEATAAAETAKKQALAAEKADQAETAKKTAKEDLVASAETALEKVRPLYKKAQQNLKQAVAKAQRAKDAFDLASANVEAIDTNTTSNQKKQRPKRKAEALTALKNAETEVEDARKEVDKALKEAQLEDLPEVIAAIAALTDAKANETAAAARAKQATEDALAAEARKTKAEAEEKVAKDKEAAAQAEKRAADHELKDARDADEWAAQVDKLFDNDWSADPADSEDDDSEIPYDKMNRDIQDTFYDGMFRFRDIRIIASRALKSDFEGWKNGTVLIKGLYHPMKTSFDSVSYKYEEIRNTYFVRGTRPEHVYFKGTLPLLKEDFTHGKEITLNNEGGRAKDVPNRLVKLREDYIKVLDELKILGSNLVTLEESVKDYVLKIGKITQDVAQAQREKYSDILIEKFPLEDIPAAYAAAAEAASTASVMASPTMTASASPTMTASASPTMTASASPTMTASASPAADLPVPTTWPAEPADSEDEVEDLDSGLTYHKMNTNIHKIWHDGISFLYSIPANARSGYSSAFNDFTNKNELVNGFWSQHNIRNDQLNQEYHNNTHIFTDPPNYFKGTLTLTTEQFLAGEETMINAGSAEDNGDALLELRVQYRNVKKVLDDLYFEVYWLSQTVDQDIEDIKKITKQVTTTEQDEFSRYLLENGCTIENAKAVLNKLRTEPVRPPDSPNASASPTVSASLTASGSSAAVMSDTSTASDPPAEPADLSVTMTDTTPMQDLMQKQALTALSKYTDPQPILDKARQDVMVLFDGYEKRDEIVAMYDAGKRTSVDIIQRRHSDLTAQASQLTHMDDRYSKLRNEIDTLLLQSHEFAGSVKAEVGAIGNATKQVHISQQGVYSAKILTIGKLTPEAALDALDFVKRTFPTPRRDIDIGDDGKPRDGANFTTEDLIHKVNLKAPSGVVSDKNCPASTVEFDDDMCKNPKDIRLKVHPDRNKGCTEYAEPKFKYYEDTCPVNSQQQEKKLIELHNEANKYHIMNRRFAEKVQLKLSTLPEIYDRLTEPINQLEEDLQAFEDLWLRREYNEDGEYSLKMIPPKAGTKVLDTLFDTCRDYRTYIKTAKESNDKFEEMYDGISHAIDIFKDFYDKKEPERREKLERQFMSYTGGRDITLKLVNDVVLRITGNNPADSFSKADSGEKLKLTLDQASTLLDQYWEKLDVTKYILAYKHLTTERALLKDETDIFILLLENVFGLKKTNWGRSRNEIVEELIDLINTDKPIAEYKVMVIDETNDIETDAPMRYQIRYNRKLEMSYVTYEDLVKDMALDGTFDEVWAVSRKVVLMPGMVNKMLGALNEDGRLYVLLSELTQKYFKIMPSRTHTIRDDHGGEQEFRYIRKPAHIEHSLTDKSVDKTTKARFCNKFLKYIEEDDESFSFVKDRHTYQKIHLYLTNNDEDSDARVVAFLNEIKARWNITDEEFDKNKTNKMHDFERIYQQLHRTWDSENTSELLDFLGLTEETYLKWYETLRSAHLADVASLESITKNVQSQLTAVSAVNLASGSDAQKRRKLLHQLGRFHQAIAPDTSLPNVLLLRESEDPATMVEMRFLIQAQHKVDDKIHANFHYHHYGNLHTLNHINFNEIYIVQDTTLNEDIVTLLKNMLVKGGDLYAFDLGDEPESYFRNHVHSTHYIKVSGQYPRARFYHLVKNVVEFHRNEEEISRFLDGFRGGLLSEQYMRIYKFLYEWFTQEPNHDYEFEKACFDQLKPLIPKQYMMSTLHEGKIPFNEFEIDLEHKRGDVIKRFEELAALMPKRKRDVLIWEKKAIMTTIDEKLKTRWKLFEIGELSDKYLDYKIDGDINEVVDKQYKKMYITDATIVKPGTIEDCKKRLANGGSLYILKSGNSSIDDELSGYMGKAKSITIGQNIKVIQVNKSGFGALNRNRASRYSFGLL